MKLPYFYRVDYVAGYLRQAVHVQMTYCYC